MRPLYFDYNATTPILPRVFAAMRPYLTDHFGNPGSGHMWGLKAQRSVDLARSQVAGLIACDPGEIIFTSCATESINTVLKGVLQDENEAHLVSSTIEHPATLQCARFLQGKGLQVTWVEVDKHGAVSPQAVMDACRENTKLISIMLANNETGALQPVAEIAAQAKEVGIAVHTDAAQAVGKIPVEVEKLGVDYLTIAGHKLYAPKGIGALFVRQGAALRPLLHGGGQEGGLRSGTENVPYIVGLGEACALGKQDLPEEMLRQVEMGNRFLQGLAGLGVDFILHSDEVPRLPNTMFVGFKDMQAVDIISGLVGLDVGVSAGAACHDDATTVSHVLQAMGTPKEYAEGTIRFSWGRPTRPEDITELISRLQNVLHGLIS